MLTLLDRPRALVFGLILALALVPAGCTIVGEPSQRERRADLDAGSIVRDMTLVADWQLAHMSTYDPRAWEVAPFWAGIVSFAPLSRDPATYLEAARANGQRTAWAPGPSPFLADDHAITQSYFQLYLVDRDRRLIAPSLESFDEFARQPFDEPLEFDHDRAEREWVWCDALFMAPPALALATQATGNRRYSDLMSRRWWKTADYLYDPRERLFYRDSRFFEEHAPNGARVLWSRGNGWVLAGLARVLSYLPEDHADRPRFLALFQAMAERIAGLQQPDGYWTASLLDPASWPGPETSGTGFVTYALAWGVNGGVLEHPRYEPIGRRGWAALVRAIQPGGMLGYAQSPSDRPGPAEAGHAEPYASGAFLLAGTEVYRLATVKTAHLDGIGDTR